MRETQTHIWMNVNEEYGRSFLGPVLKLVVNMLEAGNTVIVHCRAGKHRTGAFCAMILVHIGMQLQNHGPPGKVLHDYIQTIQIQMHRFGKALLLKAMQTGSASRL